MNRKAILITTSSEKNPTRSEDAKALRTFLQSQFGGKWEDDEIFSLENPTKNGIAVAVDSARHSGYAFVMFEGRGRKSGSDLPWPEMEFFLSPNETISERELNPGAPRCTLFLTCPGGDLQVRDSGLTPENPANTVISKIVYNQALAAAESGLVKVHISALDGAESKTPSFTRYLIGETMGWLTKNKGVLSLGDAINLARAGLLRDGFQINLDYLPGRRRHDFPFAVKL